MDRRLLFPAVVATAWAQQTSPATAEAEKALRARAEQFFQLEVDKSFRKAEAFVATESKDYYYDNNKPDITGFRIDRVELSPDGKQAKLTTTITTVLRAPGIGAQEFTTPVSSDWKLENGQWCWYYLPVDVIETPFGKWQITKGNGVISMPPGMPADASNLQAMVTIDRTALELSGGNTGTVTITNNLPGIVNLELDNERPLGLVVSADKTQLGRGEKAMVSFSAAGDAKPNGTFRIKAGPVQDFLIQIRSK